MTDDRSTETPAADEAEVRAVLDRLYAAWLDYDADRFVADYAEDASSILPGSLRVGRDQVRDRMAASFAGPLKGSKPLDEVQSVRFIGAHREVAVVVSRSCSLAAGETAAPDDRWIWATWTLAEQDGRWLVEAYHNCPTERPVPVG
ncbi:MAG TPA: SgcJ/EcaC family oxidoreductase [Actinocrinis sp.]|nr:SgcJ/EcaC family oxidoreductase [Actinocrinis sp.]